MQLIVTRKCKVALCFKAMARSARRRPGAADLRAAGLQWVSEWEAQCCGELASYSGEWRHLWTLSKADPCFSHWVLFIYVYFFKIQENKSIYLEAEILSSVFSFILTPLLYSLTQHRAGSTGTGSLALARVRCKTQWWCGAATKLKHCNCTVAFHPITFQVLFC